jgi:mono/diheme cytochrome c family protein
LNLELSCEVKLTLNINGLKTRRWLPLCALGSVTLLSGCTRDFKFQAISMWNESRFKPFEATTVFRNGTVSQEPILGTVARGRLVEDNTLYTGRVGSALATKIPFEVTPAVLQRGQERFNIYCSPCHGVAGDAQGMIVKRGFAPPPDYAIPRLRAAPVGHFYDVITNGYGVMYSYAARVDPTDRWAIAAYIRVLQASRPVVPDVRPRLRTLRRASFGPPASNPSGQAEQRSLKGTNGLMPGTEDRPLEGQPTSPTGNAPTPRPEGQGTAPP